MADKPLQTILDALARAVADPAGTPLFANKGWSGLFAATAAAKPLAQRALDAGWLRVVRRECVGKAERELVALTESGAAFLAEQRSPRVVLDDFVRAVEARRDQLAGWQREAKNLGDQLDALRTLAKTALAAVAGPPASPSVEPVLQDLLVTGPASPTAGDEPLSTLFARLRERVPAATVGQFHDALRALHAAGRVYLHPWTGPLYLVPDPAVALMVGHEVAYYASPRTVSAA